MFFVGIMGIGNKEKNITEQSGITCKACGSYGRYTISKRYHYFHIFFLPVWTWGEEYYVTERTCNTIFRLKEEVGKDIEKGTQREILPNDLTELFSVSKCKDCGSVLEDQFHYCPYCGEEQ